MRSSYCSLAHGQLLAEKFYDFDSVAALPDGLDEADRAVTDLAEKVVDDATSVSQEDVDRLRSLGFSDGEIVDVVLAATIRCFFSKTLDALGVQPDPAYAELPAEFREALVAGRSIEST